MLQLGNGSLFLPDALAAQAQNAKSSDVLLGLRPQNVTLAESEDGDVDGAIYSHEMIGREQQLVITTGAGEVRCRLQRPVQATAGASVGLRLSLAGARLFDAVSERALAVPQRQCRTLPPAGKRARLPFLPVGFHQRTGQDRSRIRAARRQ